MSTDTNNSGNGVSANRGIAIGEPDCDNKNQTSSSQGSIAHVPPALDGPNNDTIWFELVENEDCAVQAAKDLGWHDAEKMDMVAVIIRDDFREFYLPLNSSPSHFDAILDNIKEDHLKSAAKYNSELVYKGDVKQIEVDNEPDTDKERKDVNWDSVMGEDTEESNDSSLEDDIEEMFD